MTRRTRIINRGRNHTYELDGQAVLGVTTILSAGIPKPALVGWAAGAVGQFALESPDLFDQMRAKNDGDEFVKWCKGLPNQDRDRAANRGTEVHQLAEQLAHGQTVTVPDELAGHVDSYLAFLEDWDPQVFATELVVVNRRWRYMGRLDMIAAVPALGDGLALIDIKTSRSGPFPEVALQLAAYRHAETFLVPGHTDAGSTLGRYVGAHASGAGEAPMPEIAWAGAVWVRADGYDLVPFTTGPEQMTVFLAAQRVAQAMRWPDGTSKTWRHDAITPPKDNAA